LMPLAFNPKYLIFTVILFAVEICIALFLTDAVTRPFVGDVLVVILIYCFFRIFLNAAYWKIALAVFLLACLIEVLQYFDYVARLGLENNRLISVILGRTFEPIDFIAYFTGFLFVILIEKFIHGGKLPADL
jgi:hypothetical protein